MSIIEFIAAAVVAIYAMVGGAFLNAAITSPQNTKKLLKAAWTTIFDFLLNGITFLAVAVAGYVTVFRQEGLAANPFLWVAAAQLALYGTFWGCRAIVEILLEDREDP